MSKVTNSIDMGSLVAEVAKKSREILDAEDALAVAGVVKDEGEDLASQVDKLVKSKKDA